VPATVVAHARAGILSEPVMALVKTVVLLGYPDRLIADPWREPLTSPPV
jgi:hypothetical protein